MYFNENMRNMLQELSIENRKKTIEELVILLDDEINLMPLKWFFNVKNQNLAFDKERFVENLELTYSKSLLFVFDYSKEFQGGKFIYKYAQNEINDELWENYKNFQQNKFWSNLSRDEEAIYQELSSFEAFVDCEPRTQREVYQLELNDKYNLPNYKEWSKYYQKLMKHFFSAYKLNSKISNSTKKRYLHQKLNESEYVSSLYFDQGAFIRELKMGYLEFHPLYMEIIHNSINKHYNPEDYVVTYNEDCPIVMVGTSQGFANLLTGRIGFFHEDAETLKKSLYLHFKVYANYLNIFLDYTNFILSKIESDVESPLLKTE